MKAKLQRRRWQWTALFFACLLAASWPALSPAPALAQGGVGTRVIDGKLVIHVDPGAVNGLRDALKNTIVDGAPPPVLAVTGPGGSVTIDLYEHALKQGDEGGDPFAPFDIPTDMDGSGGFKVVVKAGDKELLNQRAEPSAGGADDGDTTSSGQELGDNPAAVGRDPIDLLPGGALGGDDSTATVGGGSGGQAGASPDDETKPPESAGGAGDQSGSGKAGQPVAPQSPDQGPVVKRPKTSYDKLAAGLYYGQLTGKIINPEKLPGWRDLTDPQKDKVREIVEYMNVMTILGKLSKDGVIKDQPRDSAAPSGHSQQPDQPAEQKADEPAEKKAGEPAETKADGSGQDKAKSPAVVPVPGSSSAGDKADAGQGEGSKGAGPRPQGPQVPAAPATQEGAAANKPVVTDARNAAAAKACVGDPKACPGADKLNPDAQAKLAKNVAEVQAAATKSGPSDAQGEEPDLWTFTAEQRRVYQEGMVRPLVEKVIAERKLISDSVSEQEWRD